MERITICLMSAEIRKVSVQHGVLKKTMLEYQPEGSPFSYIFSNTRQVVNEVGGMTNVEDIKLFFATTEQEEVLNGLIGRFVHARIREQRIIEEAFIVPNPSENSEAPPKSKAEYFLKSFLNKLRTSLVHH